MSWNKVTLIGRLGQDPEVKFTPTGQAVCNFSVATSENWTDKSGQKQEKTEWHRIVVWGKVAELCGEYLTKGRQVALEGKLATRKWENKEGVTQYTTEVVANNVQFLGGNPNAGAQKPAGGGSEPSYPQGPGGEGNFTADDIPF